MTTHAKLSAHRLTPSLSADMLYQFPHRPQHVFLIKKFGSSHVDQQASDLSTWLISQHQLTVFIEADVQQRQAGLFPDCRVYDPHQHRHSIDFVITMGGDGTALHFNSLFNDSHTIPMLLSFSMGTLGFLTPFNFKDHQTIINQMLLAYRRGDKAAPYTSIEDEAAAIAECEADGGQNCRSDDEDGEDGQSVDEYVISLCPRMRLLCQVWKKKQSEHRELTEAEKAERRTRRYEKSKHHTFTDSEGDDDDTETEDEDESEGVAEQDGRPERSSSDTKREEEMTEREKNRIASIEARQCRIDRQQSMELKIVQRADSASKQSSSASPSSSTSPNQLPTLHTTKSQAAEGQVYLAATYHPLNELLLSSSYSRNLTTIDLSLIQDNGKHQKVSTVLADALIISTATGSTAYSMSAGGPMVSPNTHCLIVTPVCPHTLSFRPLVLPDSTHLLLAISADSRAKVGRIICDGAGERKVRKGEWVTVRQDSVPIWSVNYVSKKRKANVPRNNNGGGQDDGTVAVNGSGGSGGDEVEGGQQVDSTVLWFRSISSKLGWNTREGANGQHTAEELENAVDEPELLKNGSRHGKR